jgi:hypothetical protein
MIAVGTLHDALGPDTRTNMRGRLHRRHSRAAATRAALAGGSADGSTTTVLDGNSPIYHDEIGTSFSVTPGLKSSYLPYVDVRRPPLYGRPGQIHREVETQSQGSRTDDDPRPPGRRTRCALHL